MTEEFRLVLCEPVVRARVAKLAKSKKAAMRKWQGPLMPHVSPEWEAWYQAQRGVIIKVVAPEWRHIKTPKRTRQPAPAPVAA
jgi:hypothetical protein